MKLYILRCQNPNGTTVDPMSGRIGFLSLVYCKSALANNALSTPSTSHMSHIRILRPYKRIEAVIICSKLMMMERIFANVKRAKARSVSQRKKRSRFVFISLFQFHKNCLLSCFSFYISLFFSHSLFLYYYTFYTYRTSSFCPLLCLSRFYMSSNSSFQMTIF